MTSSIKDKLRPWAIERRRKSWYPEAGQDLARQLLGLELIRNAKHIAGYHAISYEMDLGPGFDALRALGKRLYLPRVEGRRIQFYDVTNRPPLVVSRWGIPEPTPDLPLMNDVDVILCPGLLFDMEGGRLGYGGGYYDRWLSLHPEVPRLGIGFGDQWTGEGLPLEEFDQPMHGYIMERGAGLWQTKRDEVEF